MTIKSILDNDFYKFTMMEAVWAKYPKAQVTYAFTNRDKTFKFNSAFLEKLKKDIQNLSQLKLQDHEYAWLHEKKFFSDAFLDYLKAFRFNPELIQATIDANGDLDLKYSGLWVDTILFEVPLLALITESYFATEVTDWDHDLAHYQARSLEKGKKLSEAGVIYGEIGTRRRCSYEIQKAAIEGFMAVDSKINTYIGTSNVHFSEVYKTPPVGTMAHEWVMGHAGMFGVEHANRKALETWLEVHKGKYDTALTDTYTTDLFFKDITKELAEKYGSLRQDSGSPFEFTDKALEYYKNVGIDPKTKKIIYSDSLDVEKAIEVKNYAAGKIDPIIGIGTHFTNDFPHKRTINIVIKLETINGTPVAKTTDDPSKATGPKEALEDAVEQVEQLLS